MINDRNDKARWFRNINERDRRSSVLTKLGCSFQGIRCDA